MLYKPDDGSRSLKQCSLHINLKNIALKLDKLLHATCRLTYSAVQHTVKYVQLSSTIELVAPYLQSINPLNAELNPICHFLALLGGATIVVVSRLRLT